MIAGPENSKFARERERMVEHDLKRRGITEAGVLSAMGRLLREEFVPESYFTAIYSCTDDAGTSAE
jgi:protein-L-isoaspartate O-methyltransferase